MYKVKVERQVYLRFEHTNQEMYKNACPICDYEHVSEDVRFAGIWLMDAKTEEDYGMICVECVKPLDRNLYRTLIDARIEQERSFESQMRN